LIKKLKGSVEKWKKKSNLILIFLFSLIFSGSAKAKYWLIIGTYRKWTGGRPEVSEITSPFLQSITMNDLDTSNKTRKKLLIKYTKLFGKLIVYGLVYLEVI